MYKTDFVMENPFINILCSTKSVSLTKVNIPNRNNLCLLQLVDTDKVRIQKFEINECEIYPDLIPHFKDLNSLSIKSSMVSDFRESNFTNLKYLNFNGSCSLFKTYRKQEITF